MEVQCLTRKRHGIVQLSIRLYISRQLGQLLLMILVSSTPNFELMGLMAFLVVCMGSVYNLVTKILGGLGFH